MPIPETLRPCHFRSLCPRLHCIISASAALLGAQAVSDSGTFVVRHARDTVATERFSRTRTKLEGTLAIRERQAHFTAVDRCGRPRCDPSTDRGDRSGRERQRRREGRE